jgi:hypothetical protein
LISELEKEKVKAMGIEPVSSIEEGLGKTSEIPGRFYYPFARGASGLCKSVTFANDLSKYNP